MNWALGPSRSATLLGNRTIIRPWLRIRPAIEPEEFDLCPVLLAQPAADRWTTIEASRPFFDRIKGTKELVMLENCGHYPIEEPGVTRLEEAMVALLSKVPSERRSGFPA